MEKKLKHNFDYVHKGIAISPVTPSVGDRITIRYDGILSKNGASEILVHLSYGSNQENEQDVPMVKRDTGYEATVPALKEDFLKLSFKEPLNNIDANVDDNAGKGYSIDIMG